MTTAKRQFICEFCQTSFESKQRGSYEPRYCSVLCRNRAIVIARKDNPILGKRCPVRGHYSRDRTSETCSACSHTRMDGSHLWTDDEITYLRVHYPGEGCVEVGKTLGLDPKIVRNQANRHGFKLTKEATQRIVNAKAREYMTENNPMFTSASLQKMLKTRSENPEKLAEIQAKIVAGQQRWQRDKPSRLEFKLRGMLNEIGVQYEAAYLIKPKFVVDIRIGNLIIEADGDYWHGHPRFEPLTDRQLAQKVRDQSRNAYLTKCGYSVVRVWESDLTKDRVMSILQDNSLIAGLQSISSDPATLG